MRKILAIIIALTLAGNILGNVVAKIEDRIIDSEELFAEMQKYANSEMNLEQIQQKALDDLIERNLLLLYAKENEITVEDNEVEAFFINELG
ncbi:MAG: SurA N-terminal domain-containing protein, partial [Candidatus Cloacimonadota bacterium]|nr:SurA N-terminal domain-containing protein [Candidatus Cloacimonadota bacterium]